jgi:hypothetical protein
MANDDSVPVAAPAAATPTTPFLIKTFSVKDSFGAAHVTSAYYMTAAGFASQNAFGHPERFLPPPAEVPLATVPTPAGTVAIVAPPAALVTINTPRAEVKNG